MNEKKKSKEQPTGEHAVKQQAALLELAHDAFIVRDLHARIIYWNKGAEKLYGWLKEEAEGKIVHELLRTQYPVSLQELEAIVLTKGTWQGELFHRTRGNAPIIVESRWALQRDESGKPIAMLEINRDITARRVAESGLQDYAKRLERSNRTLQDFAFVASHDLKEPLRKIYSFGDRLRHNYAEQLGSEGNAYLERIQDAAVRMQGLLDDLLMYSRTTTRTEPFVPADLSRVMVEVLLDLELPIQETKARVEIGELPEIQADPSQMRQLFQNLVGNALKFHKEGHEPLIRVFGRTCREGQCQIIVEDNGIGFEEKYLDRIFQPFQRLHGRSSPYQGTGMGLAICRMITDRHNGSITAHSSPEVGTTFIVTLPLRQCDAGEESCAA